MCVADPYDGWELIHTYTRSQALADGVLEDVSELAREAGFKIPVAITEGLRAAIDDIPLGQQHQDPMGRLWDVLTVAGWSARKNPDETIIVYRLIMHNGRRKWFEVKMQVGGGDWGEPVITLMLPGED